MGHAIQEISSEGFDTWVESRISDSVEIESSRKSRLSCVQAAVVDALEARNVRSGTGSLEEKRPAESPDYHASNLVIVPSVRRLPPAIATPPRMTTFHALQEWEGYVVGIEGDEFVARMVDVTAGHKHESEEATIPLEEISSRDAANLALGDVFRWVIGYEHSPSGGRKRVSEFVFRELPKMTKSDFQEGKEWAEKVASVINP